MTNIKSIKNTMVVMLNQTKGSSWYLSTLYANKDVSVVDVNKEIRNRIIHNKLKLLSPEKLRIVCQP